MIASNGFFFYGLNKGKGEAIFLDAKGWNLYITVFSDLCVAVSRGSGLDC